MNYFKRLLVLISSLLVISCIGEDVEGGAVELAIQNDGLFSLGINETNNEVLQLKTSLDGDANFRIEWSSNNPEVINVDDNGKLLPSADSSKIGETATITANAFEIGSDGSVVDGGPIAGLIEPKVIRLGKITIRSIQVIGLPESELEEFAQFGFEEILNKVSNFSSLDISDQTQQLSVEFIDFNREKNSNPAVIWTSSNPDVLDVNSNGVLNPKVKTDQAITITASLPADLTSKGVALNQIFEITVGDETEVVEPDPEPVNEKVLIGSGSFRANNGYNSRGGFQIFRDSNGVVTLEFDNNFAAPIPRRELYASNTTGNDISNATLIATNYPSTGSQTFNINFDITNFKYIYIYCAAVRRNAGFGEIK